MPETLTLNGKSLRPNDVFKVAVNSQLVQLDPHTRVQLDRIGAQLDGLIGSKPYYGINTGFGALAEKSIQGAQLERLQYNLIVSHAVGVGAPLSYEQARALMLLRANTLAYAASGCRSLVIDYLIQLLNAGCAPYVPSRGSVGASGDLAPLAHLALLLLGEGDALIKGELSSASEALKVAKLEPIKLKAKEGLALINGTQAMGALGCMALSDAAYLVQLADGIGACSLAAMSGSLTPFDNRIHQARPHAGQLLSAAHIRTMLSADLNSAPQKAARVQDAYSLRCMPQVHGATHDVVAFARQILTTEINSATDNPLLFENGDSLDVLSGGNFHGQYPAFALDFLAIAVAELANISERRVEQMLNPHLSGLPAFLTPEPGINSGFMILQVTATALVNENKILSHPASTDSIPSSAGREDHVSMGMTSANKLVSIIENVYTVLAVELMCCMQALDLQNAENPYPRVRAAHQAYRQHVTFAKEDRQFRHDLLKTLSLLKNREIEFIWFEK